MKLVLIFSSNIILNFILSVLHMQYTGDKLDILLGNVFISMIIAPLVVSLVIGISSVIFLGRGVINGLKCYWWIVVSGVIAMMFPVGWYIFVVTHPYRFY